LIQGIIWHGETDFVLQENLGYYDFADTPKGECITSNPMIHLLSRNPRPVIKGIRLNV